MKRLMRALGGDPVWPPPIWLMRQAGRYLPEYREVRAQAGDFLSLCTAPALATEVTLQPLRRYGFDAAILFSDILILPWALGRTLRFEAGEGPVLDPIVAATDVSALDPGRVTAAAAPVFETVSRLAAAVGEATLIGFAGSPWTVACYMVDGHGAKDFPKTRLMSYREPALFAALIDVLVEATATYLLAQVAAGAETVMLFDSWAGVLPMASFDRWVTQPTLRIVARLKQHHPALPVIGFPRLAGTRLPDYAARTGVQAVALDTQADPELSAASVADGVALQGNLDPLALVAGNDPLAAGVDAILHAARQAAAAGRPWVFNLGHGIVPETPPAHVAALVQRVRGAAA